MVDDFDFHSRYRIEDYGGVAWYVVGYERTRDEDYDWTGIEHENRERVVAIMVGDDRRFTFDVDQLIKIDDEDYCPECGQLGCKAYSRDE